MTTLTPLSPKIKETWDIIKDMIADTGVSIAPYNHVDTGSPFAAEYVWGRQVGDNTINP